MFIFVIGKLRPLTLTAHKSGHTIGGTIWSLRSPLHTVSSASSSTLIYAPIFNHVRESHLDSAALVQATGEGSMRIGLGMSRPMVMVVGTERSLMKSIRKKDRDRILLGQLSYFSSWFSLVYLVFIYMFCFHNLAGFQFTTLLNHVKLNLAETLSFTTLATCHRITSKPIRFDHSDPAVFTDRLDSDRSFRKAYRATLNPR